MPVTRAGLCTNHWDSRRPAKCASNSNEMGAERALSVIDSSERQVNARLDDRRFLWNFVLEVFLRRSSHDQQAAMWQSFRKCHASIVSF